MPYLIAGLGNPGREYRDSRHNIGFRVLNTLAGSFRVNFSRVQSNALITKHVHRGKRLILAKPQTYMNNSGQAVGALARFYKIDPDRILVVYDDLDLPPGKLRLRPAGGSGGHRGLKSIIQHLGTDQFPRLRIGIGRPPGQQDPASYVLHRFSSEEEKEMEILMLESRDCILSFLDDGVDTAMNRFNAGSPSNGSD